MIRIVEMSDWKSMAVLKCWCFKSQEAIVTGTLTRRRTATPRDKAEGCLRDIFCQWLVNAACPKLEAWRFTNSYSPRSRVNYWMSGILTIQASCLIYTVSLPELHLLLADKSARILNTSIIPLTADMTSGRYLHPDLPDYSDNIYSK